MPRQYFIKKPYSQIPPRDPRVFNLTADIDIDIIKTFQGLATGWEMEVQTGSPVITINDEATYSPVNTLPSERDNILIYRLKITGVTAGYLILYVSSLSILQRYDALEVG